MRNSETIVRSTWMCSWHLGRVLIRSGYNKGTIRSDIRYLVVSKDVHQHRLISISYITTLPVTAEAAGSSPVVPAIHSKRVRTISLKPSRTQKGTFLCLFWGPFRNHFLLLYRKAWIARKDQGQDGCLGRMLGWRDGLSIDIQCGPQG
jgi:hypothetical protein